MRASTWMNGLAVLLASSTGVAAAGPAAATLQSRTTAAYDVYVTAAEAAFLTRVRLGGAVGPAAPDSRAEAVAEGRIVKVPDGLIHHWRGTIHLPNVSLERVIATAQCYDAYARMYGPVAESRLLRREQDRFHVRTRVRASVARVSVVLEVRSLVRYSHQATSASSIGASEEIREVVAAGQPHERLLPVGRDRGYLWRANTFTRFVPRAGGVDVELETIGLSRRFPPMLGWLIEPIARRLGRESVERTLSEFAAAVRTASSTEPVPTTRESAWLTTSAIATNPRRRSRATSARHSRSRGRARRHDRPASDAL